MSDSDLSRDRLISELALARQELSMLRTALDSDSSEFALQTADLLQALSDDFVFWLESDGKFIHTKFSTNPNSPMPPYKLVGHHYREVTPPQFCQGLDAALPRLGAAGQMERFEAAFPMPDGKQGWYEVRLMRSNRDNTVMGVVRDITTSFNALSDLKHRAVQLSTVAQISTAVSTILDLDEMLQAVVDLTREHFGLYHTHIYMLDSENQKLVLTTGAGEIGKKMTLQGHEILVSTEQSLVARAAREAVAVIVNDVRRDPGFLPNPLLPDTRSEMSVPLVVGDRVLGVLDVQSNIVENFSQEDADIFSTLASQVAVAVQNARQYAELSESETMVRQLINSTPDWIFVKDLQHRYVLTNEGYASALHMTPEMMIGKDDLELGFPEEMVKGNPEKGLAGFWQDDNAVFESGQSKIIPNDLVQIDGLPHIFHTYKTPVRDVQGKIIGVLAFARDVTELKESQKKLSEALNAANMAYWEFDVRTGMFTFNDDFYAVYGTTAAREGGYQMAAQVYSEKFVHPEDAGKVGEEIGKALQTNDPNYHAIAEARIIRMDGQVRDTIVRFNIEKDADGNTIRLFGANQDVTERKQIELEMESQRRTLQAVLDNMDAGVFMVEAPSGRPILSNKRAEEFLGRGISPEAIGDTLNEVYAAYKAGTDELYPSEDMPIVAGMFGFSKRIDDLEVRRPDGSRILLEVNGSPVYDKDKNLVASVVVFLDITERSRVEKDLETQRRTLQAVLENMPAGVFMVEAPSGRPILSNKKAEEFLGRGISPAAVGDNLNEVYAAYRYGTDQLYPAEQMPIVAGMYGQTKIIDDMEVQRPDGSRLLLEVTGSPVFDRDGKVAASVVLFSDITRRKEDEIIISARAKEMALAAELGAVISSLLEPAEVLQKVVDLTKTTFELYHAHIYLLNETGDTLTLVSGAGDIGARMVAEGRTISMSAEKSLVARAARLRASVLVNDVYDDPEFLSHPLLPLTRSELAAPIIVGNQVLGVIDVQSETVGRFTEENAHVITVLASQVAVALQNARQYAELSESETMVRQLINSTPDWIFVKDINHRYTLVNEGYASMVNMAPEAMIGKDDLELGFPEEIVKGAPEKGIRGFWQDDDKVVETGEPLVNPYDPASINGVTHIFHTYKTPVRDVQGKIIGVLGFSRDVTEINKNQEKLSEALNVASMAYWEFDVRTGMFTFNDDFYAVYGTTAAREGGYQMAAQVYSEKFVHPEDAGKVGEEIGKALQTNDPNYHAIAEARIIRMDGQVRDTIVRFNIEKDADGNTIRLFGANQDVTERKQAELEMESQRRTLQAVLDNMPAGVFMVEAPSGRPILSNKKAEEFLGRGISPDAIGDTLSEVYAAYRYGTDDLYPSDQMPIVAGLFGQSKTIDDMEVRRPDGSSLLLEVNGSPVYDAKGNLAASVVVFTDITERRKAQDQLVQRAREMATVAELGTAISTVLDPEEMLQQVVDLVKERFDLYHAHLYLMNPTADTLVLAAGAGQTGRTMVAEGRSIPVSAEQSLVARAARSRLGVIVNDVHSDPEFLAHPLLPDTRSELAVPLLIGERVLGVLDVQSQFVGAFGAEDVNIQTTLAAQVAVVLENVRQYAELSESETMVRQLINSTPDWIFVKDTNHRYTLVNEGYASALHMNADEMLGKDDLELGFPEEMVKGNPEKGLSGFWADDKAVFDSDQSKIIPNDLVQIDGEPHIFHTLKTPVHDVQGKVTGVLAFARDVTDREKLLEENRRLYEVSRRLNSAQSYEEMILSMVQGLNLNDFEQAGLLRLDRGQNNEPTGFTVLAHWVGENVTPERVVAAGDHFSFEDYPSSRIMISPEALFISDLESDSRFDPASKDLLRKIASRSTALLPLYLGDVQIGTMTLQSDTVREFNSNEIRYLPVVSNQLAVAVQNRMLFDQTKEALTESQALYKVNSALSASQSMKDILVGISQPSIDVGANVAQLFVTHLDDQQKPREIELLANWVEREGASVSPLGTRFDVTRMFFTRYWAAHPDEPMLISDVLTDPNLDDFSRELLVRTNTGAVAVLPMMNEGLMTGVILIKWGAPHNFSALERRLYKTLAGPAAIVVRSRLLFDRLQRNEAQLSEALDIASLAYWEFDVATQNFLFNDDYYAHILHTTAEKAGGYQMPAMTFATQYIAPESTAAVPATIQAAIETTDPNFTTETEARLFCGDGKERYVHMHLKIQKDSQGNTVKLVGTNQDITDRKLAEATIARRAEELATVARVSTTVSTILDPDQMLQAVVDLTKERFDLYHAHVYLYNEVEDLLELRSGAGEIGRQLVAQKRAIPLSVEQSLVARAARTRQGVIVNDVHEDPGFLPNPLLPDTHAEMAIPILLGDRVMGVLDVQSRIAGRFTEEDVTIMTTLAAQVAVALQNGRAYLRAQRQAEREALLNTISERIQATTTVENALQVAVRELGRALGAQRTTVQIRLDDNESGSKN